MDALLLYTHIDTHTGEDCSPLHYVPRDAIRLSGCCSAPLRSAECHPALWLLAFLCGAPRCSAVCRYARRAPAASRFSCPFGAVGGAPSVRLPAAPPRPHAAVPVASAPPPGAAAPPPPPRRVCASPLCRLQQHISGRQRRRGGSSGAYYAPSESPLPLLARSGQSAFPLFLTSFGRSGGLCYAASLF